MPNKLFGLKGNSLYYEYRSDEINGGNMQTRAKSEKFVALIVSTGNQTNFFMHSYRSLTKS